MQKTGSGKLVTKFNRNSKSLIKKFFSFRSNSVEDFSVGTCDLTESSFRQNFKSFSSINTLITNHIELIVADDLRETFRAEILSICYMKLINGRTYTIQKEQERMMDMARSTQLLPSISAYSISFSAGKYSGGIGSVKIEFNSTFIFFDLFFHQLCSHLRSS